MCTYILFNKLTFKKMNKRVMDLLTQRTLYLHYMTRLTVDVINSFQWLEGKVDFKKCVEQELTDALSFP